MIIIILIFILIIIAISSYIYQNSSYEECHKILNKPPPRKRAPLGDALRHTARTQRPWRLNQ